MQVKNIGTNPIHGIKPGETGELPKNRESRLKQYVKYGMLEVVEEVKAEEPKAEEVTDTDVEETTEEPKKQARRGRKKVEQKAEDN